MIKAESVRAESPVEKVILEMGPEEADALLRLLAGDSWYDINGPTTNDPKYGPGFAKTHRRGSIFATIRKGSGVLNHLHAHLKEALRVS